MKKLLATAIMIMALMTPELQAEAFNTRGVITLVNSVSLSAGNKRSSNVLDVSDRDPELCVMVYGSTPDDSLVVTVEILGMFSPNLADTSKAITVYSSTNHSAGGAVTFADTLQGSEMVPYLFIRITNADADSAFTCNSWVYMKQREILQ